ncbi:enoyl-CoA hydratase [Lysinibacillus contaminans]|uniref:Enoyl-CoA hydratase n=1 Tax=Lysinibacillus contaminans TaxID=1293441 RepID=A0ABR5K0L9_9BACI|nr:MaoC family dehydratase [Lysinibacillus contaminans]KOS68396.1 enoyl-CoA hydratase [Lysinibacillus contaminans]
MPNYEDIQIGDKASFTKTISESDVYQFAGITGDFNPVHINSEYANQTVFKERVAHGILTAGFISAVLGTKLPGTDTIYLSQNLDFKAPVKIGDTVTAEVEVLEKKDRKKIIRLRTIVKNQLNVIVVDGEAVVMK